MNNPKKTIAINMNNNNNKKNKKKIHVESRH